MFRIVSILDDLKDLIDLLIQAQQEQKPDETEENKLSEEHLVQVIADVFTGKTQ